MEWLQEKKYTCLEEAYGFDTDGSLRYADIITFSRNKREALILDPTVNFESNDAEQTAKCIFYYRETFRNRFGERLYKVVGICFGTRETINTVAFFDEVGVVREKLVSLVESIIMDSFRILQLHI